MDDFRHPAESMETPVYTANGTPKEHSKNGFTNLAYVDHADTETYAQPVKTEVPEKKPDSSDDTDEFRSLVPFCIFFGIGSLFSSSLNTFLSSQITVIERSFGLSSSKSGLLLSANDVGFVATVLFASHFLKNQHIPRILGICVMTFGIAGLLTSLPHFVADEKMPTQHAARSNTSASRNNSILCHPDSGLHINSTLSKCDNKDRSAAGDENVDNDKAMVALVIIGILMFIQGMAKAPRQALSSVYIDNNSAKVKTGFYIGLQTSFTIFGPFIAILVGGVLNKIPVDLKETSLQPRDPRWVGAWWIGFLIFGACALIFSIPIFFFPASMRKRKAQEDSKQTEYVNTSHTDRSSFCYLIKDIPKSVLRVLMSPIYLFNLLALVLTMFAIMVLASFGPKYIENQFHIPTWKANIVLGLEKLITTVLGTFFGGVLTRRFKLGMAGCIKMLLISRTISTIGHSFLLFLGCDRPEIVGYDMESGFSANLTCNCEGAPYLPVCADGQTFFSPCHAGCQTEQKVGYSNCTASISGSVSPGICDDGCNLLIPFMVVNAVTSLIGTGGIAPAYVVMLRSIASKDRAMAVGLQSFALSLLVFLPAPIIFGKLYDTFCLIWKSSCGKDGACMLYNNFEMRVQLVAIDIGLKLGSLLFTILALMYAVRWAASDKEKTFEMEARNSKPPIPQPRLSLQSDSDNEK